MVHIRQRYTISVLGILYSWHGLYLCIEGHMYQRIVTLLLLTCAFSLVRFVQWYCRVQGDNFTSGVAL